MVKLMVNLAGEREARGVTIYALSKALGVHRNTIANIESGKQPTFEIAFKIAGFVGRSVDEIWGLEL